MRRVGPAAIACAVLVSLAGSMALAQTAPTPVPVPRPAPLPKTGTLPPPPSEAARHAPLPYAPSEQPAAKPNSALAQPAPAPIGGASASEAAQRRLVERVNAYLTGVHTLVGDFVQYAADGRRSGGKFYLQKPGRLRFEYDSPSPVELIADGQSLVVRDRKLNTQDPYMLSQTPLRFLRADRIDLLKDTNLVSVSTDNQFVTVVIEETQIIVGTHRLALMFGARDFELKQWTITDPQGHDTTVAVYNLDKTKSLDPGLFKINFERILQ
jgi:outer membrane lipoprotein-sorting protein